MNEAAPVFRQLDELKRAIADSGAGRVVLANGCFDPVHVGHVRYLDGARQHGDYLVVAINDDVSTRALKGSTRPVMKDDDRARVVSSFAVVDAVLVFAGADVVSILEELRPACHAKGTDYTVDTVPEIATSRRLGIETVIVGDPKSHASREVVERIQKGERA